MDGRRVGHADDELVEVRPGMEPRRADRGQGRLELGRPGRAERRDVAQPVRPDRREVDRSRPARAAPGWCRCCWPPCRAGCPARARASSSRRPAGRRGRSSSRRAGRGSGGRARRSRRGSRGTGRRTAARCRAAGPRRRRCRRRRRRAGRGRRGETGSMTATNRAPAAWASRPISGIGSSRPRKFGWAAMTPATGRSGSASIRSSAARSVVPAAGPSATSGISSSSSPPLEVGPRASAGSADGRRARRGPARGGSPGRSSGPPRPSPPRRRSARPRRRRGRPARPAATRTRRCSGACPG